MPSYSIVIPCFNSSSYIKKCLESIEKQNYNDIEVILVDDFSNDCTVEIIENYLKDSILNIKLIKNEFNKGAGESRNIGIQECSNDYIFFLDSDDLLDCLFFQTVNNILEKKTYDCIVFDSIYKKNNKNKYIKMFYSNKIHKGEITTKEAVALIKGSTMGKVYRRKLIKDYGIKFGCMQRNEDTVFTTNAISHCQSIFYIETPLYIYNYNESSLMNNRTLLNIENALNTYDIIYLSLVDRGFSKELNNIYFIEMIYSTTLTCIIQNKSNKYIRKHFKKYLKNYDQNNPYFKMLSLKYRLMFYLYKFQLFWLIKRII